MSEEQQVDLVEEYATEIQPLLPLATKAYGRRDQDTPAHVASREYTRLLCEFYQKGGSLQHLSVKLGVAYSGMRRRIYTSNIPPLRAPRMSSADKLDTSMIDRAALRVKKARSIGTAEYHEQLYNEYNDGIPMNMLARQLGISNAAPLYYGVQCHYKRSLTVSS